MNTFFRLAMLGLLFCAWVNLLCGASSPAMAGEKKETVQLVVEFSKEKKSEYSSPWKKDATVMDLMQAAAEEKNGIKFEHRGSGATAFLTSIGDVANEGRGKRNWVYRVNGKRANKGFGVYKLEAGDKVTWRFE